MVTNGTIRLTKRGGEQAKQKEKVQDCHRHHILVQLDGLKKDVEKEYLNNIYDLR